VRPALGKLARTSATTLTRTRMKPSFCLVLR
jgi:hypothetical protein